MFIKGKWLASTAWLGSGTVHVKTLRYTRFSIQCSVCLYMCHLKDLLYVYWKNKGSQNKYCELIWRLIVLFIHFPQNFVEPQRYQMDIYSVFCWRFWVTTCIIVWMKPLTWRFNALCAMIVAVAACPVLVWLIFTWWQLGCSHSPKLK